MKTSQKGIELIKKHEGCRLSAYKCPAGVWTIGYGHTGGVTPGQTITGDYAETLLRSDLVKFELKVSKYDPAYHWNQNEFDAMVSFAYNIGSIDQLTDRGNRSREVIAEKILQYDKAGGKVLNGLIRRRSAERDLFLTPYRKNPGSSTEQAHGIEEYSLKEDGEKQVSKNFKVKEFRCKDGSDKILIDANFVSDKLQAIRNHFDAPVTINSAYRTPSYNASLPGAAKNSYHMKGQAFDIVVKGKTPVEVARCAQALGISGIIQYNTFVHVDSRAGRYWARDDNGKVSVKESF